MKRFYQTNWQGISFSEFSELSENELAGPEFYNKFYVHLFERYSSYEDLDPIWRLRKAGMADWLTNGLPDGAKILSVGCGLGYMEYYLNKKYKDRFEIHVADYASDSLQWLHRELPPDRIHLVDNGQSDLEYDLIYFSAVDYAMNDNDMINLLKNYKRQVKASGSCLLISASYLEENISLWSKVKMNIKENLKSFLKKTGLYKKNTSQFWGWLRTRKEYNELVKKAGFVNIQDGFIEEAGQRIYYVRGKLQ